MFGSQKHPWSRFEIAEARHPETLLGAEQSISSKGLYTEAPFLWKSQPWHWGRPHSKSQPQISGNWSHPGWKPIRLYGLAL